MLFFSTVKQKSDVASCQCGNLNDTKSLQVFPLSLLSAVQGRDHETTFNFYSKLVLFGFLERYEATKVEIESVRWNSAGLLPTL